MIMNVLDVPHFSQLDNKYDPFAACNVTSLAMCLAYYKVSQPHYIQLEDYLLQRATNNGWNRFTTTGIKQLAESFEGIKNHLTEQGTLQDIRNSIDTGWPVVVHGFFTEPGHIIVIRGYTKEGFLVNDPYGEIMGLSYYDTSKSGENLHYSNGLIAAACDSWCYGQARARYPMSDNEAERCTSLWIHRIEGTNKLSIK
ncbi:MAG: C39 family peptidase [Microcoleaceae cyanobacterium]